MSFKVILSGFQSMEDAEAFLSWYEGQGEQDESITIWTGKTFLTDVQHGMIQHQDGVEYRIKTYE